MLLIVGLGNPGQGHARNRHNIGFMAVDEVVHRYSFGPWRKRFQGEVSEGRIGGEKLLVLKPQTYMNESGRAVGEALRFYKLDPDEVVVLYDEIDLKPGKIRVKRGGGAGGHNGIRSIDSHIGKDYWRVRLGVGHPGDKDRVHGHVLNDFAKTDDVWLGKLLEAVAAELPLLLAGDDSAFMSRVSQALVPPRPKAPKPEASSANPSATQPDKSQPPGGE